MVNVNDLNFYFFDKESNLLYDKKKYKINIINLLKGFFEVLFKGIAAIPYFFYFNYYSFCVKKDFVLFAFTNNNSRSLSPLLEHLPSSHLFTEKEIRFKKVWFYAMLYSPVVLYRCFTYKGYEQETYIYNFKGFCKSYGMFKEAIKILKLTSPKFVIVSNNQSYTSRGFYKAAKKLGITTVFLQHATAVEQDPALDFDYAFLDGLEAFEKLTARNVCSSTVFLSGNPRFDFIPKTQSKYSDKNVSMGVAINLLDNEEYIKNFILDCKLRLPDLTIVLRPHPTTNIDYWQEKSIDWGCEFSNAKIENPFDFIERCMFFIAGDSSFHLDVAISDKRSFYYNFTSDMSFDLYSYIKNQLIIDISSNPYQYIKNAIQDSFEYKNDRVVFYVANYGSVYWRKSATLIADTLINIKDLGFIDKTWNKKENFYQIKE